MFLLSFEETVSNLDYVICLQVVFEGVRGVNFAGDIGLDDISLQDGLCSGRCWLVEFQSAETK